MANITISDLHKIETQVEELSTLELGTILGGDRKPKYEINLKWTEKTGVSVGLTIKF